PLSRCAGASCCATACFFACCSKYGSTAKPSRTWVVPSGRAGRSLHRPSASVAEPPSSCHRASRPARAARWTATPAAGRPALVSRMCVDTEAVVVVLMAVSVLRDESGQSDAVDLRQFGADGLPLLLGRVADPFPDRVPHLLAGQAGGADEEHMPEPLLVGQVQLQHLRLERGGGGGHARLFAGGSRIARLGAAYR